jgi:SAM-dependent methyltransferase
MSRGQDIGHLQAPDRARVFSYIYDRGLWRNGESHGSLSGVGSELQATDGLRSELSALLASLPARSILDVGCGDFTWMQHVDLFEMKYVGVDIVPTVMEANKKAFSSTSREFILLDAVTDRLPTCDVVLCREVLFHLSFADGQRLLENIRMSGALHVLLTSDTGTAFNADIKTGDFRILNLQKRPYRLPPPKAWIPDGAVSPTRGLALWRCEDLPPSGPR